MEGPLKGPFEPPCSLSQLQQNQTQQEALPAAPRQLKAQKAGIANPRRRPNCKRPMLRAAAAARRQCTGILNLMERLERGRGARARKKPLPKMPPASQRSSRLRSH